MKPKILFLALGFLATPLHPMLLDNIEFIDLKDLQEPLIPIHADPNFYNDLTPVNVSEEELIALFDEHEKAQPPSQQPNPTAVLHGIQLSQPLAVSTKNTTTIVSPKTPKKHTSKNKKTFTCSLCKEKKTLTPKAETILLESSPKKAGKKTIKKTCANLLSKTCWALCPTCNYLYDIEKSHQSMVYRMIKAKTWTCRFGLADPSTSRCRPTKIKTWQCCSQCKKWIGLPPEMNEYDLRNFEAMDQSDKPITHENYHTLVKSTNAKPLTCKLITCTNPKCTRKRVDVPKKYKSEVLLIAMTWTCKDNTWAPDNAHCLL